MQSYLYIHADLNIWCLNYLILHIHADLNIWCLNYLILHLFNTVKTRRPNPRPKKLRYLFFSNVECLISAIHKKVMPLINYKNPNIIHAKAIEWVGLLPLIYICGLFGWR